MVGCFSKSCKEGLTDQNKPVKWFSGRQFRHDCYEDRRDNGNTHHEAGESVEWKDVENLGLPLSFGTGYVTMIKDYNEASGQG
ncbi:hypothetical protein PSTG_10962 [Puccinia striiformis f. sp. tritici PST-78]|uniref:Uncharacterized protein n=1 Tax=Puccinia striiformis f. sp. tritici PST-78 TaxID=1165861 RepID=A0A0L0V974_9BASI|nr:hypothetical protein PSTG_10962 [Puccinia striiformis f. sp. tritici PST-78]